MYIYIYIYICVCVCVCVCVSIFNLFIARWHHILQVTFFLGGTVNINTLKYGLPGQYLLVQKDFPVTIN